MNEFQLLLLVLSIPKQKGKYQQKKNLQAIAVLLLLIAPAVKLKEGKSSRHARKCLARQLTNIVFKILKNNTAPGEP